MKNKSTTYLLIAVVLLIWGYIVYKIYNGITGDDINTPIQSNNIVKKEHKKEEITDIYDLGLNYRDPFLGNKKPNQNNGIQSPNTQYHLAQVNQNPRPINHSASSRNAKVIPEETIDWGIIKFKGTMKNPNTNKIISLIETNGRQQSYGEGAFVENFKILKIYKDSIKVGFKNKVKTITR